MTNTSRSKYLLGISVWLSAMVFSIAGFGQDEDEAIGLYRYHNAEGSLVIDYSIPPEYAEQGYDIISPSGTLIKRVPSRADMNKMGRDEIEARKEQEKQDAYILATYRTLTDVEMARRRKLESIQREIDILKTNLTDALRRQEELKDKAATYQASGRQAPESIVKVIEELTVQQAQIQNLMEERRSEIGAMNRRFDGHAARLVELRPGLADSKQHKAASEGKSRN
jgi:chromosome segregation ATPase